jgi:hypothetical protein
MYTKYPSTLVKFHDRYEVFQNARGASLIHISIVIMFGEWPAGHCWCLGPHESNILGPWWRFQLLEKRHA